MTARLKTVATNRWLNTIETTKDSIEHQYGDLYIVTFSGITGLNIGQYYKIQLAFNNEILGYYSSVGVFKYTEQPTISLENPGVGVYTYTGVCDLTNDPTEKIYSYEFIVRDADEKIVESSGTQIHNNQNDYGNQSIDEYTLQTMVQESQEYTIEYRVTTINGIELNASTTTTSQETVENCLENFYNLSAINDYDNGRVVLSLQQKNSANENLLLQSAIDTEISDHWGEYGSSNAEVTLEKFHSDSIDDYCFHISMTEQAEKTLWGMRQTNIPLKPNTTYTLSAKAIVREQQRLILRVECIESDSGFTPIEKTFYQTPHTWSDESRSLTFTTSNFSGSKLFRVIFYSSNENLLNEINSNLHEFYIYQPKLEEGGIATAWSPAGTDIALSETIGCIIGKSSAESNYSLWNDIDTFMVIADAVFPEYISADYIIEQGVKYKYSIQLFDKNGNRSKRMYSNIITADFEDLFLYDGYRQLKVKYNPKVSSFKTTTLETKVDTIGGQFPFFFRNGNVSYKDFPISGLISYLMDSDEQFITNMELNLVDTAIPRAYAFSEEELDQAKTLNLTTNNFYAERTFKIFVLSWLNNGKAKLFKSPTEGNFIVRLMNISLSPNDQLSRMLHTFNSNAYEVAEYNFKNLTNYNFIKTFNINDQVLRYSARKMSVLKNSESKTLTFDKYGGAYKMILNNVAPGTVFEFKYKDNNKVFTLTVNNFDTYTIGIYDSPLEYIKLISAAGSSGHLSYGYYVSELPESILMEV